MEDPAPSRGLAALAGPPIAPAQTPTLPPASSQPPTPAPPPLPPPDYKLYDSKSIILATFLGSPLAGGWLMALNYRRLGDLRTFRNCIILSFVGTIALIAIGALLPDKTPSTPIAIGSIIAMGAIAKLQSEKIDRHQRRGGQLASRWKAAGTGLLSLILILGTAFCAGNRAVAGFQSHLQWG